MPYAKRKQRDGTYKVINTETQDVKGSGMTEAKADSQLRLLNAVEHNPDFRPKPRPPRKRTS